MGKREIKTLASITLGALVVIVSAIGSALERMGPYRILFVVLGAIVFIAFLIWFDKRQKKIRRQQLTDKYGDVEIVELIMDKKVWVGATSDHVIDSWGNPEAIDRKVLKTKVKEIWKYNQQGRNRFGNRVILNDGIVVGHESGNIRIGSG